MTVIEKNVPLPPAGPERRRSKYPWPHMMDGDSVVYDGAANERGTDAQRALASARQWVKRHAADGMYVEWRLFEKGDGEGHESRIWFLNFVDDVEGETEEVDPDAGVTYDPDGEVPF